MMLKSIIAFAVAYTSYGPFPLSSKVKCVSNLKGNHAHIENHRASTVRHCDVSATH